MDFSSKIILDLTQVIDDSLRRAFGGSWTSLVNLERPKSPDHGDYSCNIAMQLARELKLKPRDIAQKLVDTVAASTLLDRVEIAGPGFINLYISKEVKRGVVRGVLSDGEKFGSSDLLDGQVVQVEFVSANPTGPLHVGHGRGAAYGASLCNILEMVGCKVHREYYVNDAGRQMDILAVSTWLRYLQQLGHQVSFPENCYQGEYVKDMASGLLNLYQNKFDIGVDKVQSSFPTLGDDVEEFLDQIIDWMKSSLGDSFALIHRYSLETQLEECRTELSAFGVEFDTWFSERSLFDNGLVAQVVEKLDASGFLYEKDGATWFKSTDFGDEKDRVVQRENGIFTYFASDIAYHAEKFGRGFTKVIDIWGADHHGYIPRVRAALDALGVCERKADRLVIPLVQFAVLYRGGEKLAMSTRSGEFVTLSQLREDVGRDAARFFYVFRKNDQHLDFDLDLAKSKNNENPVYYIQYAHARCNSVLQKWDGPRPTLINAKLHLLNLDHEEYLLNKLIDFPVTIQSAAKDLSPHLIAFYLKDLASMFHSYYNAVPLLGDDADLTSARLSLVLAIKQVIRNGLDLLGVSAPERM